MPIMQICPDCRGGLIWKITSKGMACCDCGYIPPRRRADQNIVDEPEAIASSSSHMEMGPGSVFPAAEQPDKGILAPSIERAVQRKNSMIMQARGGLHVAQKCKFCKQDATKAFQWAEGMAYIPACDKHHGKARHIIEVENNDEVVAVKDLPKRAAQERIQDEDLPSPREEGAKCKKTAPAWAVKMKEPFTVDTIEGPTDGKKNDYLLEGPAGDKWVVDQKVFEKTYKPHTKAASDEEPVGACKIGGLDIILEWHKGDTRSGKTREGKKWSHKMHADYGYIPYTEGVDGEGVDVYVGPNPDSDTVYIIEQLHDGKYDEDKCMLGFDSADDAENCYRKHFPDDGEEFFGDIREMDIDEFACDYLGLYAKHKDKYLKKKGEIGQNLITLEQGIEDSGPVSNRDVNEAYHGDNINEDKDLHLGSVLPPYSSGHGPSSTHEDNDLEEPKNKVLMQSTANKGIDPYKMGRIYSYDQLIPQHQHEIDINWTKGRGRHFVWLRTALPTAVLLKESERWYNTNRHRKWGAEDDERIVKLAEAMVENKTITPLLVSPPGEQNGGVWEGYHRLRAGDMLDYDTLPVIMKIDPRDEFWQEKFAGQNREPWICVDLDGTILEEDPNAHKNDNTRPPLGEPFQGAAEEMQQLMNIGRVSIYTARQYFEDENDDSWKEEIAEHLAQHKIPFDDIYVGKKPPADVFIDNKNVRFEGEWPGMADMIRSIITKDKYKMEPHHEVSMGDATKAAYTSAPMGPGSDSPDEYVDPMKEHEDDLAISEARI